MYTVLYTTMYTVQCTLFNEHCSHIIANFEEDFFMPSNKASK